MEHSKSSYKKEVYSNASLPQETRKISNNQPNLTPKTTRERRKNKSQSQYKEINHKYKQTLARLIRKKKKRERVQINEIRKEKGEGIIDTTEMQRIIRDYYKQLYANKIDNLEETDKYLERYQLPRLNQEKIENMNRRITIIEIKSVI